MFLDLFVNLRAHGVRVTTHDWLAFLTALGKGVHENSFEGLYQVARCVLVASEGDYDAFDQAFLQTFGGVEADVGEMLAQLDAWLRDPKQLLHLDPALRAALESLSLEDLRQQLLERLATQKKRHEGGNRWIGSGGTSPFGQGGVHPSGVRMGGSGGGRSALAVADARRFREYRRDRVLDTRQTAAALRRLRMMARAGAEEVLDLDGTVDATARNCGDLEIVTQPPRKNDVRVALLMDVGGSMDPHAHLVEQLFSAAHQGGGFREFEAYYFHNCVYGNLYRDAAFTRPIKTRDFIQAHDPNWRIVLVGDAYMHPGELMMSSSAFWDGGDGPTGLTWLARLADRFPRSAWLNPEPERIWSAPTINEVRRVFDMFHLSLDGLTKMVEALKRPPRASHRARVHELARRES